MTTVLAAAPRPLAGTVWTILLGLAATILSLQGDRRTVIGRLTVDF